MIAQKPTIILIYVLCINGKTWYSATDIRVADELNPTEFGARDDYGILKGYIAHPADGQVIIPSRPDNLRSIDWEPRPSDPSHLPTIFNAAKSPKIENIPGAISSNRSVEFRNNILNNNIIKINRPKRKRCPINRIKSGHLKNAPFEGRFLEVFEVVQFDHVSCLSSTGLEGTCLHEYDCQKSGGTPMGSCADGYGVCCVTHANEQTSHLMDRLCPSTSAAGELLAGNIYVSDLVVAVAASLFHCDGRSSASLGWFTNPGFPSPSSDRLSCVFTLDKLSEDIKQIRVDFLHFELLPPNAGTCELDQFVVTGHNKNNVIPIICGINTGQHVYIEVSEVAGPIIISLQTITAENRLFAIKITQLMSNHELAAPAGCLQFYKEAQGHIESFNHRERSEVGIIRSPSYFNNLNYAICIKRAPACCSVTYTNVDEMEIVNYDTEGVPIIPPQQAGVEILNCPSDWLLLAALRLCGERLNDGSVLQDFSLDAPVTDDSVGPVVVRFRSDGAYSGRGFRLYYQQNSCTA